MIYTLGTQELYKAFNLQDFAFINTLLDCGKFDIAFYYDDELKSPIDDVLFTPVKDWDSEIADAKKFFVNFSEDFEAAGDYKFAYTIFLEEYPDRLIERKTAFNVKIIDPCLSTSGKPSWCPVDFVDPGI